MASVKWHSFSTGGTHLILASFAAPTFWGGDKQDTRWPPSAITGSGTGPPLPLPLPLPLGELETPLVGRPITFVKHRGHVAACRTARVALRNVADGQLGNAQSEEEAAVQLRNWGKSALETFIRLKPAHQDKLAESEHSFRRPKNVV